MELGDPDAGKPPVRFDEGREPDGHWVQTLSVRWLLPILHAYETSTRGATCDAYASSMCELEIPHSALRFLRNCQKVPGS
jgi:hypothetical protein